MLVWLNNKLRFFTVITLFCLSGIAQGQELTIENFSMPICANGGGEDSLNFYESYNGEYNGCDYKVVFATLFTAW